MDMEMESREESLRGFLGNQFNPHGLHAIDTTHREEDETTTYATYYDREREGYRGDDKTWMYSKVDPNTRMQRSSSYPTESFSSTTYRKDAGSTKPDFSISYTPTAARNPHPNISPTGGMSPFRGHDEVANGIMNSTSIPEVGNNDTQKHLRSKNLPSSILFNSGRWSIEEHNRFVQGLGAFPHGVLNRWRKISKAVGTRTVLQTRTHAQKFFRKLQKQDELKAMNDEENYVQNGDDLKGKAKVKTPTGPVSYTGVKGPQAAKEEPQAYSTTATGRLSDPGQYEASNPARSLTALSTITDHHMPRTSYSQQQHHPSPSTFPSNLFPSISIPTPTSNTHLTSAIATPTTESSRAFSNMSLGPRTSASPNTHPTAQQPQTSFPSARGNDQWVDWLLSNIDTIVTKNGRGPGDDNRPHAKSTTDHTYHRSSSAPTGRTFRSASESALNYRQESEHQQQQQQQHGSWEVYSSNYNNNHHGSTYYTTNTNPTTTSNERDEGKDKTQNDAFYDNAKYAMPGE